MKFGIYVIRDSVTGYMTPTFDMNDTSAMRNFRYAMSKSDSVMSANKSDFSLYRIGSYDSESGEIRYEDPSVVIDVGLNAKNAND